MTADCKFDGIGNDFTADERGLHPLMPHGDTVSNGDGGEFARRTGIFSNAFLGGLRLTVKRNVTRCCFVPCRDNTNQRLIDFFFGHAHGIVIRTVRCPLRANGNISARQF